MEDDQPVIYSQGPSNMHCATSRKVAGSIPDNFSLT